MVAINIAPCLILFISPLSFKQWKQLMIYREPSLWFFKFECHHRIIGLERAYWCSDVQYMRLPAHLVFQKKKIVCVSAEIQLATQLSNALHRTVQYLLLVRQFAQLLSLPLLYSPLCPHLRHHPRKCCFFFFPAIFNSFGHPSYLHLESKLERLFHLRVFFFLGRDAPIGHFGILSRAFVQFHSPRFLE